MSSGWHFSLLTFHSPLSSPRGGREGAGTTTKMKVTVLGSGTSTGVPQLGCRCMVCTSTDPRDRRYRCSSLVEVADDSAPDGVRRILIDCGPDFREQMLRINFQKLDAIFITHEHYDHVGGLDDLRPFSVFGDVVVYAEPFCANHLRERIPYCFTPKERRYPGVPSIDLEDILPHQPVNVGKVEVLPLRVMHGKLPILGFRIGNSHQTIEEAIAFSRRIGTPETYFIHMSHHTRPHAIEDASLPPHFHLAYDGLEIEI